MQKPSSEDFNDLKNEVLEKEILLSINNDIASIRNKNDLHHIIQHKLNKLLNVNDFRISLISEKQDHILPFLVVAGEQRMLHPDFPGLMDRWPLKDGVFDKVLKSGAAVVTDLDAKITSDNAPGYIKFLKDTGLSEIASVPLNNGRDDIGVMCVVSEKKHFFKAPTLKLLKEISSQIAIAVENILANEAIEQREKEKDILLTLSTEIAGIRDKKDLLPILQKQLEKISFYSDISIAVIDENKKTFSGFLIDPKKDRSQHPGYPQMSVAHHNFPDGVFETVLNADCPVIFELASLMKRKTVPAYISFIYENGITDMVGIAMRDRNEEIGVLFLFSAHRKSFSERQLCLVQGISNQLGTAVANLLAIEAIERREKEKEMLLSFSSELAGIKGKTELQSVINSKLKNLFHFTHSAISVLEENGEKFHSFIVDPGSKSKDYHNYEQVVRASHPVQDGIFDRTIQSKTALIFDLEKLMSSADAPEYIKMNYASGIAELVTIALRTDGKSIGVLGFFSDRKNSFDQNTIRLIQGVSHQLSTAILNMLSQEEISRRDRENEILLSVSDDIVTIRGKEDLQYIIGSTLKKYFRFSDCCILLYNKERNTYSNYIYQVDKKRLAFSGFQEALKVEYPVRDNDNSNSHKPVVLDVEKLLKSGRKEVDFIWQAGIRECVTVKLINGKNLLGLFVLLSEQPLSFRDTDLHLLQRISYQVSKALANIIANDEILQRDYEKEILLTLSNEMACLREKKDLLKIIHSHLKKLFPFKDAAIGVIDTDKRSQRYMLVDGEEKRQIHSDFNNTITQKYPFPDGIFDVALNANGPVIFDMEEIMLWKHIPDNIKFAYDTGVKEFVAVALRNSMDEIGVFYISSETKNSFSDKHIMLLQGIASQLSIAVANILANEDIQERQREKSVLLDFSNDIAGVRNKEDLALAIDRTLKDLSLIKEYVIRLINEDQETSIAYLFDPVSFFANDPALSNIVAPSSTVRDEISEKVLASELPVVIDVKENGVDKLVGTALRTGNENIGILWIQPDEINNSMLMAIAAQISIAISNILANQKISSQLEEIRKYKQQLEVENLYLQEEIGTAYNYSEIIGAGEEMQKVFHLLSQVAFTNSTVLVLGETGTGKELIARAIHNSSPRKDKLMVKVNCAAMPANLIESELFGHERGSFTGATERRIGKFELANHGTLFLDEIGEMPLDLQVKLLRVLQEKEIERVGGKTTIKTDVRIITATNRNLEKEVNEGRFRSDLYYRLNVFPITLPPLRDRKEDIPILASHFIARFARNAGKKINNISHKVMQDLVTYNWPGNVRELEHLVERSVLLTNGNTIKTMHLPGAQRKELKNILEEHYIKTIEENERDHILEVLKKCKGKIFGKGGAAELLGVHVSTLNSKIKKLGIKKEHFFSVDKE